MDESILTILAAMIIVIVAVGAILRGIDVRLSLLLAALAIGGLQGDITPILREFLATFSNEKFVVPICSAMGFAYVLRHTECDQHLVRSLTAPLRRARLFLIPGVVAVGFLINIPVISQTSTAVCLGAVVVPLMRAANLSGVAIGATILLGASIGGELLNPGAPELNTVGQRLGISPTKMVPRVVPLLFPHLVLATLIFWFLIVRSERRNPVIAAEEADPRPDFRVNVFRALVPVMLLGVVIAGLSHRQKVRGIPKAFFDGAGYAFTEVISLIVIANCFGKAIESVGLARGIGYLVEQAPGLLTPIAGLVPCGFAAISGSGIAATQSVYAFFVAPAQTAGLDPADIGAVVSVSSAAGRTLSPVAAVALMAGRLTGTNSFQLMARVAPPLLISLAVVIALRMLRIL